METDKVIINDGDYEEMQIAMLAWRAFPDESVDPETGERVDDYGYPQEARKGYKAGFLAAKKIFQKSR